MQGYGAPRATLLGTRMLYLHLIPRHCTSSNADPIPRITFCVLSLLLCLRMPTEQASPRAELSKVIGLSAGI